MNFHVIFPKRQFSHKYWIYFKITSREQTRHRSRNVSFLYGKYHISPNIWVYQLKHINRFLLIIVAKRIDLNVTHFRCNQCIRYKWLLICSDFCVLFGNNQMNLPHSKRKHIHRFMNVIGWIIVLTNAEKPISYYNIMLHYLSISYQSC